MSIQRSVQQQNAARKAEIQRVAASVAGSPASSPWLFAVLQSNQLSSQAGLLVRLSELPEQEGNLMSGVWLTESKEFWEFSVVLSRSNGELLSVERFCNVTASVPINPNVRGTGSSFGFLACVVLSERLAANPSFKRAADGAA